MDRARNDFDPFLLHSQLPERVLIHLDNWNILTADNQQCRGFHQRQRRTRQIRPSATRNYGEHVTPMLGCRDQRSRRARARSEIADQ